MLQKNLVCYTPLFGWAENFGFSFLVTNSLIVYIFFFKLKSVQSVIDQPVGILKESTSKL